MQILALEYLRFADGLERSVRETREEEHRRQLLDTLVKGALVASGEYQEKVLFAEYFPDEDGQPHGESRGDADTDMDYSDVDFGVPEMDEMLLLAKMLSDDTITVDGAPLEGPDAQQISAPRDEEDDLPALPPPREFDPSDVEQDSEWV